MIGSSLSAAAPPPSSSAAQPTRAVTAARAAAVTTTERRRLRRLSVARFFFIALFLRWTRPASASSARRRSADNPCTRLRASLHERLVRVKSHALVRQGAPIRGLSNAQQVGG